MHMYDKYLFIHILWFLEHIVYETAMWNSVLCIFRNLKIMYVYCVYSIVTLMWATHISDLSIDFRW